MEALDFMAAFGVPDIGGEWVLDAWLGPVYQRQFQDFGV